jgi:hypothetical protein
MPETGTRSQDGSRHRRQPGIEDPYSIRQASPRRPC